MSSSLPNRFVSLSTLQQHLEVSDHHLRRQVKTGELKLGIHYLLISSARAKQQSYLWNPATIQELWSSDPALRVVSPRSTLVGERRSTPFLEKHAQPERGI